MQKWDYSNDEDFIDRIIIPLFIGAVNKNLISAVYDKSTILIIATNKYAQLLGYKSFEEIKGKKFSEIYKNPYPQIIDDFNRIHYKIFQMKRAMSTIGYVPKKVGGQGLLSIYRFPIFNPNEEVVAVRSVIKPINVYNSMLYLNQMLKRTISEAVIDKKLKIHLTHRQKQVLFLLTMGFSQKQAAQYLDISRGTLARIIHNSLCPAFDISGSNTKLLISKTIQMNYFKDLPDELLSPMLVEFDNWQ